MSMQQVVEFEFDCVKTQLNEKTVREAANGTGYFDGLMSRQPEGDETIAKFKDHHGRIGFVLYTAVGNVVLFQRHAMDHSVWTSNVHHNLMGVIPNGALSVETVEHLIGACGTNPITMMVDRIIKAAHIRDLAA